VGRGNINHNFCNYSLEFLFNRKDCQDNAKNARILKSEIFFMVFAQNLAHLAVKKEKHKNHRNITIFYHK
jgi:hypothetical protein